MKNFLLKFISLSTTIICTMLIPINNLKSASNGNVKSANISSPKVSVIVPVYNVEDYLSECLDSIINQTLKDIEIICVNDGSKDSSLEILKNYEKNDDRIHIIDKQNGGVASARNAGLDATKGQYITFVDSDDIIKPNTYELAFQTANDIPDADIICFGWENFPKNKSSRSDYCPKASIYSDWFKAKKKRESIYVWNKLYKRSLIIDNNLKFNTNIKYAEDECFNLSVYPLAKKIVSIDEVLYKYRFVENSITHYPIKKKLKNYIKMWKYIISVWKSYKVPLSTYFKLIFYPTVYSGELLAFLESCL